MLQMSVTPDLIFYNVLAVTMDELLPRASAVAVRKHRIVVVGESAELLALAGPDTRRIDGQGATLLPGFCDSHIHFGDWSLNLTMLAIADTTSRAQMLARLAERAAQTPPGGWILARGWNESRWGESTFPTRAELDAATGPDHPALLYRSDMHSAVANSAALAAAGITSTTEDPPQGLVEKNARGEPTGLLKEMATYLVARHIPLPTESERLDAMRLGIRTLHRLGVTAIHDQRYGGSEPGSVILGAFQTLKRSGELALRVNCNVSATDLAHAEGLGVRAGFGDDRLRLGHIKFFMDGSLGSRTAWMIDPFARQPGESADNYGVVVTPPDEVAETIRAAAHAGFSVSVHAIGDRANRELLDVFEELAAVLPAPAVPHRIEHVQMIDPDDAARLPRLNLTASVQPVHALDDMDTADLLLGPRADRAYRFRSLLDAGTRLAFGSDAPVADPSPWLGLHAAVVRRRPERQGRAHWFGEQRIPLHDALRAYTLGAAEAAGWQQTIGSISVGKRADLILLDRDLETADAESGELAQTRVRLTLFNGDIVWEG